MSTFEIVVWTLVIYSAVSTISIAIISYFVSDQSENIIDFFAFGIVGTCLAIVIKGYEWGKKIYKKNFTYLIFRDKTDELWKCKMKYVQEVWNSREYKIVKNYVKKQDCLDIKELKEF